MGQMLIQVVREFVRNFEFSDTAIVHGGDPRQQQLFGTHRSNNGNRMAAIALATSPSIERQRSSDSDRATAIEGKASSVNNRATAIERCFAPCRVERQLSSYSDRVGDASSNSEPVYISIYYRLLIIVRCRRIHRHCCYCRNPQRCYRKYSR